MTQRILLALILVVGSLAVSGCRHPYSGDPETLKKPRKKKRKDPPPPELPKGAETAVQEEPCRTNFFDQPPRKVKRQTGSARDLAREADQSLLEAESAEGESRLSAVLQAMSKLSNALKKDPYGPEPTFKYAVAYALAGRKACALAFLQRLNALTQWPDTQKEADRVIQRALREPAFQPFRKEADGAMGQ